MHRTHSYPFLRSIALQVFIGGVSLWALGGTPVWGEEANPQSYSLQEIIDLTLTHNPAIAARCGRILALDHGRLESSLSG